MRMTLYIHETITVSVYHHAINPWCLNSLKLQFFRMNTPQGYFVAKTRDLNQFARPISKYNLQCQSSINTVTQHQNTVQG